MYFFKSFNNVKAAVVRGLSGSKKTSDPSVPSAVYHLVKMTLPQAFIIHAGEHVHPSALKHLEPPSPIEEWAYSIQDALNGTTLTGSSVNDHPSCIKAGDHLPSSGSSDYIPEQLMRPQARSISDGTCASWVASSSDADELAGFDVYISRGEGGPAYIYECPFVLPWNEFLSIMAIKAERAPQDVVLISNAGFQGIVDDESSYNEWLKWAWKGKRDMTLWCMH